MSVHVCTQSPPEQVNSQSPRSLQVWVQPPAGQLRWQVPLASQGPSATLMSPQPQRKEAATAKTAADDGLAASTGKHQ